MLESDILKRTEGLPDEHYDPLRLLHLAHIANDQAVLDLGQRKDEWQALVEKADKTGEIGMFTIHNPWFHPDDCFEYLITYIHYCPKKEDEDAHVFATQRLFCARLYGSRTLECNFRSEPDIDHLKKWLLNSNAGFERYQSLEQLMTKMKEWLV